MPIRIRRHSLRNGIARNNSDSPKLVFSLMHDSFVYLILMHKIGSSRVAINQQNMMYVVKQQQELVSHLASEAE